MLEYRGILLHDTDCEACRDLWGDADLAGYAKLLEGTGERETRLF